MVHVINQNRKQIFDKKFPTASSPSTIDIVSKKSNSNKQHTKYIFINEKFMTISFITF